MNHFRTLLFLKSLSIFDVLFLMVINMLLPWWAAFIVWVVYYQFYTHKFMWFMLPQDFKKKLSEKDGASTTSEKDDGNTPKSGD